MTLNLCTMLLVAMLTAQNQSAKPPNFDEVVAGLVAAEARIENLSVRTEYVKIDAFLNPAPLNDR